MPSSRMQRVDLGDGWKATLPVPEVREALIGLPAHREAMPGYSVLKCSHDAEVFRVQLGGKAGPRDVVVKVRRRRGLAANLAARLGSDPARREFQTAVALHAAGVATARPVALLERSTRRESWLITEYLAGGCDLDQVVLVLLPRLDPARLRSVKSTLVSSLADLACAMQRQGFRHRDFKASNIMVTSWDGASEPPRAWLVDLEGVRCARAATGTRRLTPLVRLAASLLDYASLSHTDYARFLRTYHARSGEPERSWRASFRAIAVEAELYRRRSRGRKTHKLDGFSG
ncbi:MAG: hypothetical protein HY763_12310 [Planctomycetes bacterium]|nr:hypothetical protein [Planctomycetota bacterium]